MVFTKVAMTTDLYWIWFPLSPGFPPALPSLPWLGRRPRGHRQPSHKQAGGAHPAGGELPLENDEGGDEKGLWIERQVGHTNAKPNLTQPSNQAFET